jgi:hypothetical protein
MAAIITPSDQTDVPLHPRLGGRTMFASAQVHRSLKGGGAAPMMMANRFSVSIRHSCRSATGRTAGAAGRSSFD